MTKKITTKAEYEKKLEQVKAMEEYLKLRDGLPHLFGFKHYKWSREIFDSTNPEIYCTAANQLGKAGCVKSEIVTPNGVRVFGDLKIGDEVYGANGLPTKVIGIPFRGVDDCFEIIFNDGTKTIASKNHLWVTKDPDARFRKRFTSRKNRAGWDNPNYGMWSVKTTIEIFEHGKYAATKRRAYNNYVIPLSAPVLFSGKDLFDPYYSGLWIGNGVKSSISFNHEDADLAKKASVYGNYRQSKPGCFSIGVNAEVGSVMTNLFGDKSFNKHIPKDYLFSSIKQRRLLLSGLLDTDGSCEGDGARVTYSTSSKKLSEDVAFLVTSLGGMSQTRKKKAGYKRDGEFIQCRDCYELTIWLPFNPFLSIRKSRKWRLDDRYKFERVITEIIPIGKRECMCITVDNDDSTYLIEKDFIVTHNSFAAIRKNIALATDPTLWPKFWPGLTGNRYPSLFWYFLPTLANATTEVETKWMPFYLPQGEFKDHPQFGWKAEFFKGEIHAINFNTGVQIQFKSYTQKLTDLQSATVYHVTLDEEPPVDYLPEIRARLNATDGKMLTIFTATRGQDYFRRIIEPLDDTDELQKDALKLQVSLYDSQYYEDGTPSPWTDEKIKRAIANCPTAIEVQRRIYGKFVKSEGLKYESFDMERNTCQPIQLEKDWPIFSGVDIGSGGKSGHPSAIIFIATTPDYKTGYVFRGWRGDGVITASNDVIEKYMELRGKLVMTGQVYDYSARDFFTYASRLGLAFRPADKARDAGASLLNTLFKTGKLKVFRNDPELTKLVQEIQSLASAINKSIAKDDMIDAMRYCAQQIPWDFSDVPIESLGSTKELKIIREKSEQENRKDWFFNKGTEKEPTIEDELDAWDDLY